MNAAGAGGLEVLIAQGSDARSKSARAGIRRALHSVLAQKGACAEESPCKVVIAEGDGEPKALEVDTAAAAAGHDAGSPQGLGSVKVERVGGGGRGVAVALVHMLARHRGVEPGESPTANDGSDDVVMWLDGRDFLAHDHVVSDVEAAFGAGCQALVAQPVSYPTPRHDANARLKAAEEAEALYLNSWRSKLGTRIRLGLNPPPPVVAARRWVLERALEGGIVPGLLC